MVKTEEKTKPQKKKWDETDAFLILGIVLAIGVLGWLGWRIFTSGDCHEFCVHGIIGARYTGTPHEHNYQETNLS